MVDARGEARRLLGGGAVLTDARPASRVAARVRIGGARGTIIGTIGTQRETKTDDQLSDRAVRDVLRRGLFRSRRRGRIWHAIPFEDRSELQDYLGGDLRFWSRVGWRVPDAKRDEH